MLLLKWFLAICTAGLLAGISVMILMCVWQIFNEVVVDPIKSMRNRVSHADDGLVK